MIPALSAGVFKTTELTNKSLGKKPLSLSALSISSPATDEEASLSNFKSVKELALSGTSVTLYNSNSLRFESKITSRDLSNTGEDPGLDRTYKSPKESANTGAFSCP